MEARELIADALETAGTTHHAEDLEDAISQTKKTITLWGEIQRVLDENGKLEALESLRRQHGLKMNQLEEELQMAVQGAH